MIFKFYLIISKKSRIFVLSKIGTKDKQTQQIFNLLKFKVMKKTINLNDEMFEAIAKGKNVFETNVIYCYFGNEITITRRNEPYFYATPSNPKATRSRRYFGTIRKPDGTTINLLKPRSGDGWRGGEIARECGLYVTKEREDKKKLGNLYEMTNRSKAK